MKIIGSDQYYTSVRNLVLLVGRSLDASDVGALLVAWLDELLFAMERDDACMSNVRVDQVSDASMRARVELDSCGDPPDGTELKAATYHQLTVRETPVGWEATVFFDV